MTNESIRGVNIDLPFFKSYNNNRARCNIAYDYFFELPDHKNEQNVWSKLSNSS